jgi:hypothetical protein
MKFLILATILAPVIGLAAEPLVPTEEGTSWNYELIQEKPNDGLDLTESNDQEIVAVTYRLGGTEKIDNKELRKLEIYRGETLDSVDLIAIEEQGIICPARTDGHGGVIKLVPPQIMLKTPLEKGKRWAFDGTIGATKVKQQYEIADEEEIEVPAGKFHAWRIHCEQTSPAPASIDRWFVPGTGFVKVTTVVKGESGVAAQKTWMNLKELPKVQLWEQKSPLVGFDKLSGDVSTEPHGEFKTEFKDSAPTVYARWHGRGLRDHAQIRAVFIAENVADVSANYQIDEMETTAPAPNSSGSFALSRPETGWTPGDYRLEFYLDDALAATVKFKIVK